MNEHGPKRHLTILGVRWGRVVDHKTHWRALHHKLLQPQKSSQIVVRPNHIGES